jgi:transcription-repair coupling factor (superfamily II helicase)
VKLLEQSILELKGEAPREAARAAFNLKLDLRLPSDYVPEVHQRLSLYKRVSQVRGADEIERLREELRDRYGPLPAAADRLLTYAALRLRAEALGILQADLAGPTLHIRFGADGPLPPAALVDLVRSTPGASLTPQGVLRLPLAETGDGPLPSLQGFLSRLEAVAEPSGL